MDATATATTAENVTSLVEYRPATAEQINAFAEGMNQLLDRLGLAARMEFRYHADGIKPTLTLLQVVKHGETVTA